VDRDQPSGRYAGTNFVEGTPTPGGIAPSGLTTSSWLILRRFLDVINDEDIDGAFSRFQLQTKLLLNRRKN
jgi:hypothetical protein